MKDLKEGMLNLDRINMIYRIGERRRNFLETEPELTARHQMMKT